MRVNKRESGQAIVMIVISILVMVVIAALIVDGGSMYANRRAAQTAADAAALRGAYEYCVNEVAYPLSVVTEYATVLNSATAVEDLTVTSSQLEVTVSISSQTAFAKIFNQPTSTVQAMAAASCFNPSGVGDIIPIAWSCRPPEGTPPSSPTCVLQKIPMNVFEQLRGTFSFESNLLDEGNGSTAASYQDGDGSKMIYVIMDTDKFDPETDCIEAGKGGSINCDFNGDGIYEVSGSADRGWLYLEDKPGTAPLEDVMMSGPNSDVEINTWFAGKSGVSAKVFQYAQDYRAGTIALIPVFDALCEDITADKGEFLTKCSEYNSVTDSYLPLSGSNTYYRIIAFAPFYVSCVADQQKDFCPGRALAGLDQPGSSKLTIEGYFLDGYVTTGTPGGSFDLGVYILSLTE